ncbi:MAG: 3-oxoacyl-ACP reductase FabG [Firmicutes bacterium]|nr:3-oxoacyl-ACP reductase FabG [Bacillota bacterium]MDH7495709.1 3-oxoacyl-ACP reductase family protein [Bacillota bacterium]
MLLSNKIAVITGAAQGIGESIALHFAQEGAHIVACDLNLNGAELVAEKVRSMGRRALAFKVDVTKAVDIQAMVDKTLREFARIDILVNSAGILKHSLFIDMSEDDWDQVMSVNAKGTFLVGQAVARAMVSQRSGRIINISSCSGKKPTLKEAAYCASKSAVIGLTRVMALELGPYGINVNAILPGATDTPMVRRTFMTTPEVEREWIEKTALKRLGKPEDQAKVAVFLASHLADHITGESIVVSAGEMMTQ